MNQTPGFSVTVQHTMVGSVFLFLHFMIFASLKLTQRCDTVVTSEKEVIHVLMMMILVMWRL